MFSFKVSLFCFNLLSPSLGEKSNQPHVLVSWGVRFKGNICISLSPCSYNHLGSSAPVQCLPDPRALEGSSSPSGRGGGQVRH